MSFRIGKKVRALLGGELPGRRRTEAEPLSYPDVRSTHFRPPLNPTKGRGVLGVMLGHQPVVDGLEFCRRAIDQIAEIKRDDPERTCVVVFDLDNTLFDTRHRTFAILKAFDERPPKTAYFENLSIDQIRWTGAETAADLELPPGVVAKVAEFWEDEFWSGKRFGEDVLIEEVAQLARDAADVGATVVYLTGRVDALRRASADHLKDVGLPFADELHVRTKPDVHTSTSPFKADELLDILATGAYLGFFVTDNEKEIAEIQQRNGDLLCVLYGHPLKRLGKILSWTPRFGPNV